MKQFLPISLTVFSLFAGLTAKPIQFDLADKKGVNSITFEMESYLNPSTETPLELQVT